MTSEQSEKLKAGDHVCFDGDEADRGKARRNASSRRLAISFSVNSASEFFIVTRRPLTLTGIDPQKMFHRAEDFHWTYMRLMENTNAEISEIVLIPAMTLSAFTCEIYLKCLQIIDSGSASPGHELDKLFSKLNALRQKRIETHWDKIVLDKKPGYDDLEDQLQARFPGMKVPRDLPTVLHDCRNGFEQLRYEYENSQFKFYIGDLKEALHKTIMEIHPTWFKKRPHPATLPQ